MDIDDVLEVGLPVHLEVGGFLGEAADDRVDSFERELHLRCSCVALLAGAYRCSYRCGYSVSRRSMNASAC